MFDIALLRRSGRNTGASDTAPSRPRSRRGPLNALALSCLLLLAACAIPVPLQVASWLADGFSYLTTEKSVSDHGISAVVGRDCALYRGVTEGAVCRDGEILDIAVAADGDDAPASETAANGDPDDEPPSDLAELALVAPSGGAAEDTLTAVHDPLLPGECRSAVKAARPAPGTDGPWAVLNCVAPAI